MIITGAKEAILIDAQFSLAHAHRVVADVLAAGKALTTVYITHAHPDHYFGIEVIKAAFPNARIVATPYVLAAIEKSFPKKIAEWGPRLGANAPRKPTLPQALETSLALEGHAIEVIGPVQGDAANNTMLWVPSLKAVIAGDTVFGGTHVWTASSDQAERAAWLKTLERIEALKPDVVVPGHIGEHAADARRRRAHARLSGDVRRGRGLDPQGRRDHQRDEREVSRACARRDPRARRQGGGRRDAEVGLTLAGS